MVTVSASIHPYVDVGSSVIAEGLEELRQEFHGKTPHFTVQCRHGEGQIWTPSKIKGYGGQGVVHGKDRPAITLYSNKITQSCFQCCSQTNADILDSMMCIYFEIAKLMLS